MKIYYGSGEVRFENPISNIGAFEIRYKGIINAESELPSSWMMMNNERKIIGVNMGDTQPETLFTYIGNLIILSCTVTDRELNQTSASTVSEGIDYINKLNTKFEDFTQYPEDFDGTYVVGTIPKRTSIHQVGLLTEQGEWFFEDGTPYSGEYHTHGDGQSMTGSKHTKDSKNIFRKDAKGKIFKLEKIKRTTTRRRTGVTRTVTPKTGSSSTGGY